jgi:peroxiredoxin
MSSLDYSYELNATEIESMIVVLGLLFVLAGFVSYLMLIFVLHRFTYRTWIFDIVIGTGMALAIIGWAIGGSGTATLITVFLGGIWFPVIRHELKLVGSRQLRLQIGDRIPAFSLLTTDGKQVTEQDLIAKAPALLALYRGWWCPSSKSQLDELISDYESLHQVGLTIFAASVDEPAEAAPLQERVGDKITILCKVSESLLDQVGVRDQRGAPWYDRFLFGAARQDISMPAWLVIDRFGKIVFAYRSTRLDNRARPADILAHL